MHVFCFYFYCFGRPRDLHSFPTRRSSDLARQLCKPPSGNRFGGAGGQLAPPPRRGSRCGPDDCPRDRKSTRLNSSHVAISYAVFCLKKKKYFVLLTTNII